MPRRRLRATRVPAVTSLPGLCSTSNSDQLADDDTLGAVDDERALLGHDREVAHEDGLFLDLTGVAVHEPGAHEHGRAVGHVLFLALLHRELRRWAQVFVERVEFQLELERLGEVLDRADVAERVRQALVEEPFETFPLDRDQVGEFERLLEVAERIAFTGHGTSRHGSLSKKSRVDDAECCDVKPGALNRPRGTVREQ